jgi:transposase
MARRDARSLDHKTLEEIRMRSVEQVQAGESPEVVIRKLGFARSCIYTWLALYRAGGWGALRARALKGRPMKIQPQQTSWLCRTIMGKSPLQCGFEFALWTREIIRMLLAEEFQLKLSLSSVGRLLERLGLTCQRPLFRAIEQYPENVRQWLDEEYPRIRRQAQRQGAEIYFGDEACVRSDYHAGTTRGAKGRTPVAAITGQPNPVNMISAMTMRGHLRFMLTKGRVNGAVFVGFLTRLMYHVQRPIFLILDGSGCHHSRPVRDYVGSLGGKLRLFFLPPYWPELNPDEQVRSHAKRHGAAKAALRGRDDLRKFVLARFRWLQKLPWTIRIFFPTPDTQYAAL